MTSKLSNPVDSTLPRHGMFHQTDKGWKIDLYMLFKNLPDNRGARAVWYKTSQNMVRKLPEEFKRETREICSIEPNEIRQETLISVRAALVLLTYGSRNARHLDVIHWVERYTAVKLPKTHGLSRREAVFGHLLDRFINNELTDITGGDYEISYQHRLCDGKYYADFSVKHFWDGRENTTKFYWYLIEFDEEEHSLTASRARDCKRDTEINETYPQVTIIRVKHDEVEEWLQLVRDSNKLVSFGYVYLSGIASACRYVNGTEVTIDSLSAQKAYDYNHNMFADVLTHGKQPLRGLKQALDRCGITYRVARTNQNRQLKVSLDSLSNVLHRWLPSQVAQHILRNMQSD